MKKHLLLAVWTVSALSISAQSQRMVLVEEFTQASCGPCAAANPAFNALLAANTTKAISIKYQTSWPGVDPMNAQYPVPISQRVAYYGVQGVPNAIVDGTDVGSPSGCTQSLINSEYAVPSPFDINLTHSFNATYDSVFITATITATAAFTAVNYLRAQVMMVEQTISFATPPGSNGETDFYGVCRKMFPGATGSALPGTWAVGDVQTITFASTVPSYIYDVNEIAIVCFVQDNGNKQVKQAAISTTPLSVGDHSFANSPINMFPNPASSLLNINFTLTENADVVVNIYNALGELVLSENKGMYAAGEQSLQMNTEMLASGIYSVELVTGDVRKKSLLSISK